MAPKPITTMSDSPKDIFDTEDLEPCEVALVDWALSEGLPHEIDDIAWDIRQHTAQTLDRLKKKVEDMHEYYEHNTHEADMPACEAVFRDIFQLIEEVIDE